MAYENLSLILESLAIEKAKSKETLLIYDPYFCEGNVVSCLGALGFHSVHNKNEDFYHNWETNQIPDFDCIVTNPPYSGDHINKLITYCMSVAKPWFLLLPNFVFTKDYFIQQVLSRAKISNMLFYISPTSRYKYSTPKVRNIL